MDESRALFLGRVIDLRPSARRLRVSSRETTRIPAKIRDGIILEERIGITVRV